MYISIYACDSPIAATFRSLAVQCSTQVKTTLGYYSRIIFCINSLPVIPIIAFSLHILPFPSNLYDEYEFDNLKWVSQNDHLSLSVFKLKGASILLASIAGGVGLRLTSLIVLFVLLEVHHCAYGVPKLLLVLLTLLKLSIIFK